VGSFYRFGLPTSALGLAKSVLPTDGGGS